MPPQAVTGRWRAPLAAGAVTLCVWLPSLWNGFVAWDDDVNFLKNPHYRGLGWTNLRWMFAAPEHPHYQPLSWVTAGLDWLVWGMNPVGYHLTNIVLHAIAAVLLARVAAALFARAGGGPGTADDAGWAWPGALVALAWSLHPLRVEAVTWITERREVLCGTLTLLALWTHLSGRSRWITLACAAAAMLSKATAVTIPVLLMLADVHRAGAAGGGGLARAAGAAVKRHAPLFLLAVAIGLVAIAAQRGAGAFVSWDALPFATRLVLWFHGCAFCLLKTLWPSGLAPLHQGNVGASWELLPYVRWQAAFAFAASIVLLVAGWKTRRRGLGLLCLTIAFLVLVAPTGGLGQAGPQTAAERYTYQPGWILTFAAGWLVARLAPVRPPRIGWRAAVPAALVLAALAAACVRQQGFWRDTGTLWTRQVDVYPDSPRGHHHLGLHYLERDPASAERHFRDAIAHAPDYADPKADLATILFTKGREAEGVALLEGALATEPGHVKALVRLGMVRWRDGRTEDALALFDRASKADPRNFELQRQVARAQAAGGRPRDAVASFERGLAMAPADATLLRDFAWMLATHPDAAVRDGRRAVELADRAKAAGLSGAFLHVVLAAAWAEAGDAARARSEAQAAAGADPALGGLIAELLAGKPVSVEPRFP